MGGRGPEAGAGLRCRHSGVSVGRVKTRGESVPGPDFLGLF